jgi:hypothetical protein
MSAEAAATAAAAGAQMLAAAAAGPGTVGTPGEVHLAGHDALFRTDEGTQGGTAAGTAAMLAQGGKAGGTDSTAEAPAGPDPDAAGFDQQAGAKAQVVVSGMGVRLERVAAESGLPLDLLAAAVAADVQEQEAGEHHVQAPSQCGHPPPTMLLLLLCYAVVVLYCAVRQ